MLSIYTSDFSKEFGTVQVRSPASGTHFAPLAEEHRVNEVIKAETVYIH